MKRKDDCSSRDSAISCCDVRQVLHDLLMHTHNPARLLEVYYWSTEPGLAEFIRQFLALPEDVRHALLAFVNLPRDASDPVVVRIGDNGELTLSSRALSDAMRMRTVMSMPPGSPESMH